MRPAWLSGRSRIGRAVTATAQRLKVFGKALDLSRTEVAGLILLAGLAPDFRTALGHVATPGDVTNGSGAAPNTLSAPGVADDSGASANKSATSVFRAAVRLLLALRFCELTADTHLMYGSRSGRRITPRILRFLDPADLLVSRKVQQGPQGMNAEPISLDRVAYAQNQ